MFEQGLRFKQADVALQSLILQARSCTEQIEYAQQALAKICRQFDEDPMLRPIQCDQAVAAVKGVQAPVQILCASLRQAERFPNEVTLHRYPLLAVLAFTDEQAADVVPMIVRFRLNCRDRSFQTTQQRSAIVRRIDSIMQASDTIPARVANLLERAWAAIDVYTIPAL